MARQDDTLDLSRLGLVAGEGRRLALEVAVEDFSYGGERYAVAPSPVSVTLDVARMSRGGFSLRLRFVASVEGPCMRCLAAAEPELAVDAREVDQDGGGDELSSPYVVGDVLDLAAWSRDALALSLPQQVVCRPECAGLCPVCGEDLNLAAPGHSHERAPDPRWAKLRELRFE